MEKLYIEFDDISIGPITIEVEYFEEILPVFTWTNLLTGEIIKTNSPAIPYSISNSKKFHVFVKVLNMDILYSRPIILINY